MMYDHPPRETRTSLDIRGRKKRMMAAAKA